jgi:hypothetical protein
MHRADRADREEVPGGFGNGACGMAGIVGWEVVGDAGWCVVRGREWEENSDGGNDSIEDGSVFSRREEDGVW